MQGWLFWTMAAALALGVIGTVLGPLLRGPGRPERRASYDMQVYRDQLREIDADLGRGVLTQAEAEAVRAEVARRLIGAAEAEGAEAAAGAAPRRATLAAAGAVALGMAAVAGAIYGSVGAPGRADAPLAARLAQLSEARAARPSQAEVEAIAAASRPPAAERPAPSPEETTLVERLRAVVAARPGDPEGGRLLARTEASLGDWPAAREAQADAIAAAGEAATAADHVTLAEFMIIGANGYVSPEAEASLTRALELDPEDPVARYYSGLALLQGGRADLAYELWARLLAEGPADAAWIAPIEAQIGEAAAMAGRSLPPGVAEGGGGAPPVSEADRAAMIAGMVDGLSSRLAAEGGPPEDWARLIRSLGVLGRRDEAGAIWREAREVFAADPAALALLRETAAAAGVAE